MNTSKFRISQLDRFFEKNASSFSQHAPASGWIKEIRSALGMTLDALAKRLGTTKQGVAQLEKSEEEGKITFEMLNRAAEALDCELVYFLVPKTSLKKTLEAQAEKAALEISKEVSRTMRLEDQGIGSKAEKELVEEIKQDLLRSGDRKIWRVL